MLAAAAEAARKAGDKNEECRHRNSLGLTLIVQGNYGSAKQEGEKALRLADNVGDPALAVTALYVQARSVEALGRYREAIRLFEQSAKREKESGLVLWRWESLFGIGRCYEHMGSAKGTSGGQSNLYLLRATRSYESALEAVEVQREALTQEEHKAFYSEDKAELYESLVRLCLARNRYIEAAAFAERCKGMAFFERFGERTLARKKSRLEQRRDQLTQALAALKARKPIPNELRDLVNDVSQVTAKIRAPSMGIPIAIEACNRSLRRLNRVDWRKVKNPYYLAVTTLKPKSIVLEYYLGKNLACGFLLSREGVKAVKLTETPKTIADKIREFRRRAVDSLTAEKLRDDSYRAPLRDLYAALIQPFEKELSEAEMVYFVPHSMLHHLPFHALIDSNGKYLVEKVSLAYVPSINVLRHCRESNMRNRDSLLAVANPKTGWEPLPATEREAAAVSAMFDQKEVFTGAGATEKLVKEKAAQFDVLTFPTHGELVKDNPTKSNLRFTPGDGEDGKWTVKEIFETDLRANLVALSACETGLARGYRGEEALRADDFVGLTRAFMYAGVPSVLGSLWKVADDSAVALMTAFFKNWKEKGMDKAEALRQAQLAMIRGELKLGMVVRGPGGVGQIDAEQVQQQMPTNLGRHPYFWAPFLLIGDYK